MCRLLLATVLVCAACTSGSGSAPSTTFSAIAALPATNPDAQVGCRLEALALMDSYVDARAAGTVVAGVDISVVLDKWSRCRGGTNIAPDGCLDAMTRASRVAAQARNGDDVADQILQQFASLYRQNALACRQQLEASTKTTSATTTRTDTLRPDPS